MVWFLLLGCKQDCHPNISSSSWCKGLGSYGKSKPPTLEIGDVPLRERDIVHLSWLKLQDNDQYTPSLLEFQLISCNSPSVIFMAMQLTKWCTPTSIHHGSKSPYSQFLDLMERYLLFGGLAWSSFTATHFCKLVNAELSSYFSTNKYQLQPHVMRNLFDYVELKCPINMEILFICSTFVHCYWVFQMSLLIYHPTEKAETEFCSYHLF